VTTTLTHPRPAPPSSNGHRPATLLGGRPVNRTRIVAGVLLVALCTLATVTLMSNANGTTSVLVASRTIAPGDVISAGDLRTVRLDRGADINAIAADRSETLVGRTAAFTIPAGALVTAEQVSDAPAIPANSEFAGAIVKPGQYPVGLRVGDRVRVVESASAADAAAGDVGGHERGTAVVTEVQSLDDGSGGVAVSLAVPSDAAVDAAAAGAAGRLSLVVVEQR
jgi:Flp pilus assembly protein CpaB